MEVIPVKLLRMLACALAIALLPCAFAESDAPDLAGLLNGREMALVCFLAPEDEAAMLPVLEEIRAKYPAQIELLALVCGGEPTSAPSFPIAQDADGLAEALGVERLPACAVVDRFGALCCLGPAMRSAEAFAQLIEPYLGDGYAESILLSTYAVRFVDQNGDPVPGAICQVCDETACALYVADADGMCAFALPPCEYEIHVLRAPDGYIFDGEPIAAPASGGALTILLERQ